MVTKQNNLLKRTLLLLAFVMFAAVEARKSYRIKEMIDNGQLRVHSPRVMASDCKWCFFNDANNDMCIEGDLNWKLEAKTEQEYKADTSLSVPPHYNHTFIYQTTQSGSWITRFNLKKLFYNQITYSMNEFTTGMKFSFYWWKDEYAVCMNIRYFITPVTYNMISASKLEKCDKVLIKCLDNWDQWTDTDELLIGTCTLSSSEDFTMYEYKPFENEYTKMIVGNDTYMNNYCWPGHTPLYSWFMKYPNNPFYAGLKSYDDLVRSFAASYLPSNDPAFEGPTGAKSWGQLAQDFVSSVSRDADNFIRQMAGTPNYDFNPDGTIDLEPEFSEA